MNSELTPEKLAAHMYHDVVIVGYGPRNIALECTDCPELLADADTTEPQGALPASEPDTLSKEPDETDGLPLFASVYKQFMQ